MTVWLDKPEQWDKLAAALVKAGEFGIDTETYGQPDRTSPQHRARVHCWSVGLLGNRPSPRGFLYAVGRVLPGSALQHPALSDVLCDQRIRKWAHNAPHDYHSIRNEGVEILGLEDSLQWARVAVPGMTGYGLKDMEQWALGKKPRPGFLDMVKHPVEVTRVTYRTETQCVCGKKPCRARGSSEWFDEQLGWFRLHERQQVRVPTEHKRMVEQRWAVTDFVPGHERWDAWLQYSLADAVSGIEVVDWLRNQRPRPRRYPWSSRTDDATKDTARPIGS